MKIIKIFLISFIFLLQACGFQPINKINTKNFSVVKFELNGNEEINNILTVKLEKLKKNKENIKKFEIEANSTLSKKITTKDKLGSTTGYNIKIELDIIIYKDNNKVLKDIISKNTNYNNLTSQFELKQYEKLLIENLLDEIMLEINLILSSS